MTATHLSCQQASCCSPVCFRRAARLQRQTVCSKPSHEELPLSQSPVAGKQSQQSEPMILRHFRQQFLFGGTKYFQTDLCCVRTPPSLPTEHPQVPWRSPRLLPAESLFPHSGRAQPVGHRRSPVAPPPSTKPGWSLHDKRVTQKKGHLSKLENKHGQFTLCHKQLNPATLEEPLRALRWYLLLSFTYLQSNMSLTDDSMALQQC